MRARDERRPRRYIKNHNIEMPMCPATTSAGNPCPQKCPIVTIKGKRYKLKSCLMHAPKPIREAMGLGVNNNRGRKRKYTVLDIMRQRVEQDAERYLMPLEEAMTALKAIVVGNGASAHIEYTEDIALRVETAFKIFDRIYGRPKQSTEITGLGEADSAVRVPSDEERKRQLAEVLNSVGALGGVVIPANASASAPSTN